MNRILPTFLESSFLFADKEVPEHVEAFPTTENYVGMFAVFGAAEGINPIRLAVDIEHESLAKELAEARTRRQEADIDIYGYTDDVNILYPNGEVVGTYIGRWANEDN